MALKLVLADATLFKRAVDAIAVLVDEAEFVADATGLTLKATDPSQISMVDFSMPKTAFESFSVSAKTKLGCDLNYLSQVMSRCKNGDKLELSLPDDDARLEIVFAGNGKRTFSIPLIDVSQSELPNPKIEFDAEAVVAAGVLQDGLKDASLISSHVAVGTDGENLTLSAQSSKGTLNNVTPKKEGLKELKAKTEVKAMFPLDYLQDILKAPASADDVHVNMKNDAPIQVSYKIGDASLSYFLAPRIESD